LVDLLDDWEEVREEYRGWVKSDLRTIRWMYEIMGYTMGLATRAEPGKDGDFWFE